MKALLLIAALALIMAVILFILAVHPTDKPEKGDTLSGTAQTPEHKAEKQKVISDFVLPPRKERK